MNRRRVRQLRAGGMDTERELETDVMRFMAILAFALLAVFALVQSIPLDAQTPPPSSPSAALAVPTDEHVAPAPIVATERRIEPARSADPRPSTVEDRFPEPDPPREPVSAPLNVEFAERSSEVATAAPPGSQVPPSESARTEPAEPARPAQLRFESAAALERLVAGGRVGFYALNRGASWQLTLGSATGLVFSEAARPAELHEMPFDEVPPAVFAAYARDTGFAAEMVRTWGVTLDPRLRSALRRRLDGEEPGELIITAEGHVRTGNGS